MSLIIKGTHGTVTINVLDPRCNVLYRSGIFHLSSGCRNPLLAASLCSAKSSTTCCKLCVLWLRGAMDRLDYGGSYDHQLGKRLDDRETSRTEKINPNNLLRSLIDPSFVVQIRDVYPRKH